jgi:hypothetical protein
LTARGEAFNSKDDEDDEGERSGIQGDKGGEDGVVDAEAEAATTEDGVTGDAKLTEENSENQRES